MPHPRSSTTTVVAILGGNPVAGEALALLLREEGYTTKIIQESPTALAAGLLDGVDLLLLAPGLSNGVRDTLVSVVRGNAKTATMPVLTLSSTAAGELLDGRSVPVPWPSRIKRLTQQIEAALQPTIPSEGR